MRVYHRTTDDAASRILAERRFIARELAPGNAEGTEIIFVSTVRDGYGMEYGPSVVTLDIPESLLTLDDEFQTGEMHYTIRISVLRPEFIISV